MSQVASLKCGGQSLNLTVANRVILLELWWNHAAEEQAFGRVFRFGQEKESHFARFFVKAPVERRMFRMQQRKTKHIEHALQDDKHAVEKLSVVEIAELLGNVVYDENGFPKVVPDYSDEESGDDE
jgi:SNF2 family DNA or RNA helicase